MENKYEELLAFLSEGTYPTEYDKSQRQNLRRYALKFRLKDGELLFGNRRVIRTKEEATGLFREFHASPVGGHTGVLKTRTAMCSRFYWYGMSVDIAKWVVTCDHCQKAGKPLAARKPQQRFKVSGVWELIRIDLTGPLPKTSSGFQYILTATDYFSKWVEAFPLKSKCAAEVAQQLCSMIYRHGCPKRILSDQGQEFVDELNSSLCGLMKIERSVTVAYHKQTYSLGERTNGNIKRALRKLVNGQQNDWDVYLDATLFSLRSKVHTTTKYTPFMLMYGREASYPSEVPIELPLSSFTLPEASSYRDFVNSSRDARDAVQKTIEENIANSQEVGKEACARRVRTKSENTECDIGDEVPLLDMRKRGMKEEELDPDFCP